MIFATTECGGDRLTVELKAPFFQCRLQRFQPVDFTTRARRRFILGGIHRHMPALALGDIAGGVGRSHQLFDAGRAASDLDQTDADTQLENLALRRIAIVLNLAAHGIGNLASLVQRAQRQQQSELIAAQACHGVGIAHGPAQQLGNFA